MNSPLERFHLCKFLCKYHQSKQNSTKCMVFIFFQWSHSFCNNENGLYNIACTNISLSKENCSLPPPPPPPPPPPVCTLLINLQLVLCNEYHFSGIAEWFHSLSRCPLLYRRAFLIFSRLLFLMCRTTQR